MSRPHLELIIDARPRGPRGPMAAEIVLGRPVLAHLLEAATAVGPGPVTVHARAEDHELVRNLAGGSAIRLRTGPTPEGAAVLRADRLYDARQLRRRRDPSRAVVWRLDAPESLAVASEELMRRQTYQPIGRYWALGPARWIATRLRTTRVRPNAVTISAAGLMIAGAGLVAGGSDRIEVRLITALAFAMALVLDTADGHLARLQGSSSEFGRWLDANLDELGDMALHMAIAWSAFAATGQAFWLLIGMAYAAGKYLFAFGIQSWNEREETPGAAVEIAERTPSGLRALAHLIGHADVRLHVWIVLAVCGGLRLELVGFAIYYPARALAGGLRKAVRRGR